VTAKTLVLRFRLVLIQALWALMVLGPFLHAHYGASTSNGFHEDTIERVASFLQHSQRHMQDDSVLHDTIWESSDAAESPAMVVGSSLSNKQKNQQPNKLQRQFGLNFQLPLLFFADFFEPLSIRFTESFTFRLSRAQSITPPALAPPDLMI
jgi:hypothetical protein